MAKCEWCGIRFDRRDAEEEFLEEYGDLSYRNFKVCLCGECAIKAISEQADGVYFEECEECGEEFDYVLGAARFNNYYPDLTLTMQWDDYDKILCCDCAIEKVKERIREDEENGYI